METKYDRKKHNRTYYEKNSENIKRKQREKRAKMKAALQQLEAENQEIDNDTPEPEPVTMGSKFFEHFRYCQKYVIQSSHQWVTGCVTSCLQSIKEDYREQAEQYTVVACDFLKSVRLTMIVNNISNILNIIKNIILLYYNIKW